jgi:integrase
MGGTGFAELGEDDAAGDAAMRGDREGVAVTPHDLRHAAASPAISAGANVKAVVDHTNPPDSVTEPDTFARRRSVSKSARRSAAISPHRKPV